MKGLQLNKVKKQTLKALKKVEARSDPKKKKREEKTQPHNLKRQRHERLMEKKNKEKPHEYRGTSFMLPASHSLPVHTAQAELRIRVN